MRGVSTRTCLPSPPLSHRSMATVVTTHDQSTLPATATSSPPTTTNDSNTPIQKTRRSEDGNTSSRSESSRGPGLRARLGAFIGEW